MRKIDENLKEEADDSRFEEYIKLSFSNQSKHIH